jgi:translation initiation factor 6
MGLHLVDIYRSPNIGIFLKANDKTILVPKGIAGSKVEKLATDLGVMACHASVGGARLLGPLIAMNNKGILASRMIEDYEVDEISSKTGLKVERFQSRFTAVGNLVAANDHGAEALTIAIGEYTQVGAMILATNNGAAVSPKAKEKEAEEIGKILKVDVSASSVNGGIPFPSSGAVANSNNAVAGYLTTGPELVFLTRALHV